MIRQLGLDPTRLVKVHKITSDGMATVTLLSGSEPFKVNKQLLEIPNHLKPKPKHFKYVDPIDIMKKQSYHFYGFGQVATLQRREKKHDASSRRS